VTSEGLAIRPFAPGDREAVIRLWTRCDLVVDWNNPGQDIERKLQVNPEWFLVGVVGDRIVGSVMAGYEGHRGWINYLAVDPDLQRGGLGRRLMEEAEARLLAAGCPKINLQVRASNEEVIEFYRAIGYSVESVVSMGKRLVADEPH
jgi:ribosomal protein S18 acetylase RimI-like enzyme